MKRYIPSEIESKWQRLWQENGLYKFDTDKKNPKYYTLVELPYPSGDLHLGHWFAFSPADANARYMRMKGQNVFFPNGFDAFGLPAENAAIKRNIHPKDWTMSNIENMRKQFDTMGTMIDWEHEAITCLPEYYKWNQWIFLKMYEKGLAYRGRTLSNWCPSCQTVLANENIENGKCWRCGTEVIQKEIEQWFLRITEYADKLLWENTDKEVSNNVRWPQSVREGQNNWIGKSEGAIIKFNLARRDLARQEAIEVFTTRPDTLYGATFMVISPEHPMVQGLIDPKNKDLASLNPHVEDVRQYVEKASKKTELERKENREKTGVSSGIYAINPVTNESIPIWIADYVLMGYGTGSIMAVPAHDERDFEFAKKYKLPIKQVIASSEKNLNLDKPYLEEGEIINSGDWNGWKVPKEIGKVLDWLEKKGLGIRKTEYHLHDWSISRQRYWGTPVPIIHCPKCGIVPVPYEDLPVELPYEVDYTPKGKPPLATATEWLKVSCPNCKNEAKRDAETLDTFFDSAWYYYRYTDPKFNQSPFNPEKVKKLMPVDIYFGGAEHTLGHTLYARFFTKFFKDIGLVDFEEFALKRVQHGVILGPDGYRMSKSRGNVVNPDDVVKEYGSDTVRLYLCFMMPYEATSPWDPGAISGVHRFLRRIWDLYDKVDTAKSVGDSPSLAPENSSSKSSSSNIQKPRSPKSPPSDSLSSSDLFIMHKTIKKVAEDLENIKFNTAVASLMEWLNHLSRKEKVSLEEYKTLLLLLAPFAPHITEELYQIIVNSKFKSIHLQPWPKYDEKYLVEDTLTIVVQVNGKVRDTIEVQNSKIKDQNEIEKNAKESGRVNKYLEGKAVKNIIYIEGRLINIVV